MKRLLSMRDLTRADILGYLDDAAALQLKPNPTALLHKIVAMCFFEPSTRTRLSFEAATLRSGGQVIGFSDPTHTSTQKGESLQDTIRVVSGCADAIVLRHPSEGAARWAAQVSSTPVINAGDGANQHPTQTLLDLFTLREAFGHLDDIHIAVMGDLKYGRTVHSLVEALSHFNVRLYCVADPRFGLPPDLMERLKMQGVRFSFHRELSEVIDKLDVLYLTRLQKERFGDESISLQKVSLALLERAQPHLKILHPLPRQEELPVEIDHTPFAHYFIQAKNGVVVRQAILGRLLT